MPLTPTRGRPAASSSSLMIPDCVLGGLLGTERFETNAAGYKALLVWLGTFGDVTKVGVEGTGSYGSGLARYLRRVGVESRSSKSTGLTARNAGAAASPIPSTPSRPPGPL